MEEKKRILIVGVSGLLGNNLAYCWRKDYDVTGIYCQHPVKIEGVQTIQVDVLDQATLNKTIDKIRPQTVINCAALTNIDYCEDHVDEAKKLNVELVGNLVQAIEGREIKLVHVSTDNVFDGAKGNYTETDEVSPMNVYAQTKYDGELEALNNQNALVARTNIFGWNVQEKCSLAEWCIKELSEGNHIKGFTDVFFSSIYTFDLGILFQEAIEKDLKGIYHMAASTSISKYDFLVKLADLFGMDASLVEAISVDAFSFKAKRGKKLSLSVKKLVESLDAPIPTIYESVTHFYRDRILEL